MMAPMRLGYCLLTLVHIVVNVSVADTARAEADGWRVALDIDNDVVTGRDRHYTSGLLLTALAPADFLPSWIEGLGVVLPPFSKDAGEVRWAFGLGHEMYTPRISDESDLIASDRPYAGYLYTRLGLYREHAATSVDGAPYLDTLEIDLGLVGPGAVGHEAQDALHDIFPSPKFQGWDNQLENEPALVVRGSRRWRLPGKSIEVTDHLSTDLIASVTAELGNVLTAGTAGLRLRLGKQLPEDFGDGRFGNATAKPEEFSLYVFVGADFSGVAHNIFLDGNTFRKSHDVNRRAYVVHAPAGLVFEKGRFRTELSFVWNSKEFEGQTSPDVYGRWSIAYSY